MKCEIKTLGELSIEGKGSYGIAASDVEYSPNLYTYLRINKILDSVNDGIELNDVVYNEYDRNLRLKLLEMPEVIELAFHERMPHYIADYVYNLCVCANIFYQNNHILNLKDVDVKKNWLYVLTLTNKMIKTMLNLLVIDIPSVM